MYQYNYRPNCQNHWDKEDNNFERQECCFPLDIYLSVKEGKKFECENEMPYSQNYENDFQERNENYYQTGNFYQEKQCENREYRKEDKKDECCFPLDVCLKIKEGKRRNCDKKPDFDYDKDHNDNGHWEENRNCRCNHRPNQNCNCRNRCCLGFLAGCLFGNRRY